MSSSHFKQTVQIAGTPAAALVGAGLVLAALLLLLVWWLTCDVGFERLVTVCACSPVCVVVARRRRATSSRRATPATWTSRTSGSACRTTTTTSPPASSCSRLCRRASWRPRRTTTNTESIFQDSFLFVCDIFGAPMAGQPPFERG